MSATEIEMRYELQGGGRITTISRSVLVTLRPLAVGYVHERGSLAYVLPQGVRLHVTACLVGAYRCGGPFCQGTGRHDGEGNGYCSECEFGYDM